jgi:hypothetical protein
MNYVSFPVIYTSGKTSISVKCHNITEILLKVVLNTIKPIHFYQSNCGDEICSLNKTGLYFLLTTLESCFL